MDQNLHHGKLLTFLEDENRWQLKFNNVYDDTLYPMKRDSVLKYADAKSSTYNIYQFYTVYIRLPTMDEEVQGTEYK